MKNTLLAVSPPGPPIPLSAKANKGFWTGLGVVTTYNLADHGLAHFLALETLTTGANFTSYLKTQLFGATPPSFEQLKENPNTPPFLISKDSGHFPMKAPYLTGRILNYVHCLFRENFDPSKPKPAESDFLMRHLLCLPILAVPNLKFRFTSADITSLINAGFIRHIEKTCLHRAIEQPIGTDHMGLYGSLKQGINTDLFHRMAQKPLSVLLGVALLGAAYKTAQATYTHFKTPIDTNKPPLPTSQKVAWAALAVGLLALNTL